LVAPDRVEGVVDATVGQRTDALYGFLSRCVPADRRTEALGELQLLIVEVDSDYGVGAVVRGALYDGHNISWEHPEELARILLEYA